MKKVMFFGLLLSATPLFLTSCGKDDNANSGNVQIEVTDGPIDNAEVKSVFVTIAEVKVDGKTFSGFTGKKTIDIKALNQGKTDVLGLSSLEVGSYSNITFVLDNSMDASGAAPGSYVQTVSGTKHALSATAKQELTVAKNFVVEAGKTTNLVIDFDLRKAVANQDDNANDKYDFVSSADLQAALRVVVKDQSSTISGQVNNTLVSSDKIVVYAYKKGTYNKTSETQNTNGVDFKNAVASAVADGSGNFNISFVESGDYELHFASYKDSNNDGKIEFKGELNVSTTANLNLLGFTIASSTQLTVVATVLGLQ